MDLPVNALVHRDYLISAPIRLFVFDNRIEIVNPGHLPNNLTVAKIRAGNSIIRNPILVSYIAKGLLPYRGLGSGIKRALDDWPKIGFIDDREANLFTALVRRKEWSDVETQGAGEETLGETPARTLRETPVGMQKETPVETPVKTLREMPRKTADKILVLLRDDPRLAIPDLAASIGKSESAVERAIRRLREQSRLRRIGPTKGGYWEVVE